MQEESDERRVKAALTIQSWFRGELARAHMRSYVKDCFKRQHIIRELVETEEKYIRDLSVVISDFKTVLLSRRIISEAEGRVIFANIDQIRRLNELFFAAIFELAQDYWHFKVIFDQVEREVHFFKMYFEYFNNFTQAMAKIDELVAHSAQFADFLKAIRVDPKYHLLTLKDYLIKPIQRLPKYVLIMKEIKRRTPATHPDSHNIDRVLKLFQEVNHSNNDKLNRVVNSYKIGEIQKNLMLPHVISQPGVEFVLEEPVTVLMADSQTLECVLYLLNTEIIISRRVGGVQKFITSIPFKNGGGNIMLNEDHFFYKNSFTVQNGEGDSCTFICKNDEEKEELIRKVYNQLMKAEQKNLEKLAALCSVKNKESVEFLKKMSRMDLLPEVEILGTEERNNSVFKYTVYIIEVRIKSIRQKVFLRYSELLELQEYLRQIEIYPKNALLKTTWLMNHKPKKIEERKMSVQRFLKEVLSKQEVIQNGEGVLMRLALPRDFYELPKHYREAEELLKKSTFSQRSTSSQEEVPRLKQSLIKSKRASIFHTINELKEEQPVENNRRGRSKRISIQDILQANEINLGHYTRYTQVGNCLQRQKAGELIIDVLIPWIENQRGFVKERVGMEKTQRVLCLVEQLARQIGLKYFKDFRLFLQRENAGRLLDDDEYLPKVLEEMRCGKYLLVFRKMIYVAAQIEERELRCDRVRLQIIASQVIYDCKKDKYLLAYHHILRLAVLVGIAQLARTRNLPDPQQIDAEELGLARLAAKTRELVANSYTSFYDGSNTWEKDYYNAFVKIYGKLRQIGRQNSQVFRISGIADIEKEFNTTDVAQLAAISIITEMKGNPFYGAVSYLVQISQDFRSVLAMVGEQMDNLENRNCWLVVKYDGLSLYSISLTHCVFQFGYEDIFKIQPYPASILLHLRGCQVDSIKLKTTNSYSIRQLLLYYKNYNQLLAKMEEDERFEESIIELVKEQNRESCLNRRTLLA